MRLAALAATLLAGLFAGCEESYDIVPGTDPQQVVVRDAGDDVDASNLREACAGLGDVKEVVWPRYKKLAIVTCSE